MMNRELQTALDRVAREVVNQQSRRSMVGVALALAALFAAVLARPALLPLPAWAQVAIPLGLLAVMLGPAGYQTWRHRERERTRREVAERIEARFPELDSRLLAAIDADARTRPGRVVGFLPSAVIREVLEHRQSHDWTQIIPRGHRRRLELIATALLALAVVLGLQLPARSRVEADGTRPVVVAEGRANAADVRVDPGDAEVERGSPLLVVARFVNTVPGSAQLVVEGAKEAIPPAPMARSLEDPTFAGRVEAVDRAITYRVAFDGGTSPTYRVKVFTFPSVRKVDAHLTYPGYTGLESKTIEDVRHVTAVEGTSLDLAVRLNKEVASARLIPAKGEAIALELVAGTTTTDEDGEAAATYRASWVLTESARYKVELVDRDGRKNKVPTDLAVNVTVNRPPTVVMTRPGKDVRVSPVEELPLQAKTEDDFGVVRHGINYITPGGEPVDLVLDPTTPPAKKRVADHLIAFEELKAQPDQLVSYHFWAEDVDAAGKPRRTSGDLFFAEVRHFEEIFRQGEPSPSSAQDEQQQQDQPAQQAEKLLELQKQIIAATWTLIRREIDPDPSPAFAVDAGAIREGQATAIAQTGPAAQALRDPTSKANLLAAVKAMKEAEGHLTDATNGLDTAKLRPALAAEQAAYQALLKLRARETEVSRQRSRRQQGGGGSASQQQMNELELNDDENRYEEQKSAKSPQADAKAAAERRETRQVLSRLAELARRQADLNDRLKELQAALEAAKTPEAKAEAERQLKRLRDQEQQVLRDTDEVRERMEREENRDRMAEARPELDRGREQVRQAAEALENGQVAQALNEGTRAERQLKDLREDLRKKSSDRFAEDVTEMRDQARQLAEDQGKLTDQLARWDEQSKKSLRDPAARQDVGEKLAQQKGDLDKLLDRMRATVTEAEETEPLLAKELYDAVGQAGAKGIPKDLDAADQLARAGLPDEAAKSSRQAGEALDGLRQGVERAARSILGDESAALKRARDELDDLAAQANRGLARADGPNARRAARPGTDPRPGGEATGRPDAANPTDRTAPGGDTPAGPPAAEPGQDGQSGTPRRAAQPGQRPDGQQPGRLPAQQPGPGDQPGDEGQTPGGAAQLGEGQQPGQQPGEGRRPGPSQDQQPNSGQGRQPGQQPGQPGAGRQPGVGQSRQQPGQEPGEGEGQQAGQGEGQRPGQGRPGNRGQGQQPGQGRQPGQGQGQQAGAGQQPGQGQGDGQAAQAQGQPGQGQGRRGGQPGGGGGGGNRGGELNEMMQGFAPADEAQPGPGGPGGDNRGGGGGPGGGNRAEGPNPIAGEGFRQWADRLRDVEELLESPDLRAEAARIRDRARGARDEARRHAAPLDPAKLKELVADPIRELRDRVAEEVRRRESPDALVPIDRDPVPPRYVEGVRRYYERLGSGR